MQNNTPKPEVVLPFSPAAERNKSAILEKLHSVLKGDEKILEIGGGTGQHAIHFCTAMPGLSWQPSELAERLSVTNAVIATAHLANIKTTLALDVNQEPWPELDVDVIYTSNTAHIMSWPVTQKMIIGAANTLDKAGLFIMYGPFNYGGEFTSDSNQMFDASLKRSNSEQGIRDFEAIERLAKEHALYVINDFDMPANNRLLVFQKQ